ncbi:MBL fold metallo-hydrolase [Erysipelothrix sp. HDW6C]|uniref:MBL fold metallo-hydrolase n=1 Tax=Erysipelothrix sp. HDW6C TaxID=2714930 RepID=UPI00140DBC08|nr:MBL fold metallo-hydrolase [Erysipelothrix sp. HDW6C]QIK69503.1 MBL fold metallo-hydrolase [Erysipelothrix sp. HDW6C]
MYDWFTVTTINATTFAISELHHWEKVHSFLLIGESRAVLIDSGIGIYSIKEVVDALTSLPVSVITTHVHSDHIGNHHEFETIAVHELEVDWLVHGIPGITLESIRENVIRDVHYPLPRGFDITTFDLFKGQPQYVLKDNEIIDLGNRKIKILHTPGHSPGHIAIHDLRDGLLFTGDLLYLDTPIYAFYPSTNPQDLVTSLARIASIPDITMIYGSHNTLGITSDVLSEVEKAVVFLRDNDLIHFGTGLHTFKTICIQF